MKINKNTTYIGVDVGGTKIKIECFDQHLNSIKSRQLKTITQSETAFLNQLNHLIDEFYVSSVKGVSIALPGIVDHKKGILVRAPHLPTKKNLKIKSSLEKKYKTTIHIENDINAFLRGEYESSSLNRYQNVLAVMIGTGVGGSAIINGQLCRGKNGHFGEFGHMTIDQANKSTWEKLIGGRFLDKNPSLSKNLIKNTATGLANLSLIFDPDAIILGGSVYLNKINAHQKKLSQIIANHTLSGKSPKLIHAKATNSVTKGAVICLLDQ